MIALRLKDLGRWYSGGTPPRDRLEHWDGDVPWISAKDIDSTRLRSPTTFVTHEAASEHSRLVPADSLLLIVRGMALAHGLPVVKTDSPVAFNQDLRALVCGPDILPQFIYYSLIGHRWRLNAHVDRAAHGTSRVTDSIYGERIPIPDRREQRLIADFLDRECARIDDLLAELWAASEDLAALVSAEVNALVSSGPTSAMGPITSDPARMTQLPPGWAFVKLKFLARMASGEAITSDQLVDDGEFPVYGGNGVRGRTDRWTHDGPHILIGRQGAQCGNVHAAAGRFWASEHAVVVTAGRGVLLAWLEELLRAMNLGTYSVSAAQPGLAVDRILNLVVPVPPLEIQHQIADTAQRKWRASRAATTALQSFDVTLREYRDALITEAVTGQLDVTRLGDPQLDESLDAVRQGERPEVLAS